MRIFIALLTLFVISVAAAAVGQIRPASVGPTNALALSCRTSPKDSALTVVIYGEKTIALECHITGAPTVNHTTQWIRTGDDCYVPAFYVGLDEATSKSLPECSKLDAAEPCTLPNPAGLELVQHNTGFLDRPHYDITTGLTYIGLGHQCGSAKCDKESVEIRGSPISKTQASVLLWHDLHTTTACLVSMLSDNSANRTTPLLLSDNMWSALVSWTFSIGCDLAAKSQLVSRIVHGESPAAVVPAELPKWNVIHGMPVSDLTTCRNAELTLFRTRSSHIAFPHCDQK